MALPLLALVGFGTFGQAYADVRGDLAQVRDRLVPALADLADAKASLLIAQREAEENLADGGAAELGGLGERYRVRVARATQSLNQVVRGEALTVAEEQEVRVVSALVVDYTAWLARAQGHATDPVLRDAELSYARGMLCSTPADADRAGGYPECEPVRRTAGSGATSIVDRLVGLQERVRDRLTERAAWGPGVAAAAVVSALALGLLCAGLWRTGTFLRRRLRIRFSVPLAAAALPLLAVPLLTWDALRAQDAQAGAVPVAHALVADVSPEAETDAEERPFARPGAGRAPSVAELASRADGRPAGGRLAFLAGAVPFVLPAGLATAVLAGGALHAYRREYLVVVRPGAVS